MIEFEKVKILVVDDSKVQLFHLTGILKEIGFTNLLTAASGEDGLNLLKKELPDMVLLDIILPKMDGYKFCKIVKADKDLCNIPIIMMTGLDEEYSIEKSYEAGAVDYISKPINLVTLKARVSSALLLMESRDSMQKEINKRKIIETELREYKDNLEDILEDRTKE